MQALCPQCNLKKGVKVMSSAAAQAYKLRFHQQSLADQLKQLSQDDFNKVVKDCGAFLILANVVPGGGKTRLAVILAQRFKDMCVLVIVPRRSLVTQMESDFKKAGIEIFGMVNGWENNPSKGFRGIACTTSMVNSQATDLAYHMKMSGKKWVVIIDECHHLRKNTPENVSDEESDYGNVSAKLLRAHILGLACVNAVMRMSGTFSTKDDLVDGVNYLAIEDEPNGTTTYDPDFINSADIYISYTREKALKEHAIVPVKFYHIGGEAKFSDNGEVITSDLNTSNEKLARKALRVSLKTEYADQMISEALSNYGVYRKRHTKSKMLIVCGDQQDAKEVNDKIGGSWNCFLAISDNSKSDKAIEDFKACSGGSILITVGMAYEGLDVPEISHLVALTYYRTDSWVHQMFARAWRKTSWKHQCHIWVPTDIMMNEIIKMIRLEQIRLSTIDKVPPPEGPGPGPRSTSIVPIESMATTISDGFLDTDAGLNATHSEAIDAIKHINPGVPVPDALDKAIRGWLNSSLRVSAPFPEERKGPKYEELSPSKKIQHLRSFISNWCRNKNQEEYGLYEGKLCRAYWPRGIGSATIDQLERVKQDIVSGRIR